MPAASHHTPPARLAIVLSHPIQYYSPWFRWIRQHTDLTFKVFYLDDSGVRAARDEKFGTTFAWDVDLTSGYDWEFVPNLAPRPDTLRYDGLQNPALFERLAEWKPTAVLLFGYKYHTHMRLIVWARLRRIPLIFRGDSHVIGRGALPFRTRAAVGLIYRQFAAFLYVGLANREYFRAFGVPEQKLFFAPHAVDATHFDPANSAHSERSAALRAQLNLRPGVRVILFSGKLIPNKQPRELLEAFLSLNDPGAVLVVAGDGPEKQNLLDRVHAEGAEDRVRFLPFANQSEMPARYLLADLFVLPSKGHYETWGLSVNEAMHLGVPCLVSDHVGCQRDLVTDGETGWVFTAGDPGALANGLRNALAALGHDAARFGAAARHRVEPYSYAQATSGLRAALTYLGLGHSSS